MAESGSEEERRPLSRSMETASEIQNGMSSPTTSTAAATESRNQIPTNVTEDQETWMRAIWFTWRGSNVFIILYSMALIIGISIMYARSSDRSCFPSLARWLLGQMVISGMQLLVGILMLVILPSVYDTPLRAMARSEAAILPFGLTRLVTLGFVAWQLVGLISLANVSPDLKCLAEHDGEVDWMRLLATMLILTHCSLLILAGMVSSCTPCVFFLIWGVEAGEEFQSDRMVSQLSANTTNRAVARVDPTWSLPYLQHRTFHASYSSQDATSSEMACAICQTEFAEGDALSQIRTCHHAFHPQCIIQALCYSRNWYVFI